MRNGAPRGAVSHRGRWFAACIDNSSSELYPGGLPHLRGWGIPNVDDAVVVALAGCQREAQWRRAVGEETRPRPAGERVDEQVQLVDQAVGEQAPNERRAAADVDVTVGLTLEALDRVRVVGAERGGVPPVGVGQR